MGLIRAEYNTYREFIQHVPIRDLTSQIKDSCFCSEPVAANLLEKFLKESEDYFYGNSLEDDVIQIAIDTNEQIQEKAKSLGRIKWEAENTEKITEAENKLKSIANSTLSAKETLDDLNATIAIRKKEKEALESIIEEKKSLAAEFEISLNKKFQNARKNVADFIAEMTFVNESSALLIEKNTSHLQSNINNYFVCPEFEEKNDLEIIDSWDDALDVLSANFEFAGVARKYSESLAAFFCSAYINKQPVFLVGPNADAISKAFASSISAGKHGILSCEGNYDQHIIDMIGDVGEDIVIINNLLISGWVTRLPEILSKKNAFFIATHPFSEDLQVEPKSLFNYLLPLCTEFIVDKQSESNSVFVGCLAKDFEELTIPDMTETPVKILSKIALSPLTRKNISDLVTTMHAMRSETNFDDEFLFALLPIAQVTSTYGELLELLSNPDNENNISKSLLDDVKSVLGYDY